MDLSLKVSRTLKRLRDRLIEGGLVREETQREDFIRLVVADWDSEIARFKRGDGSIYRLFELDCGRGFCSKWEMVLYPVVRPAIG